MRRNLLVLSVVVCAVIVAGVAAAEDVKFPYAGKVTVGKVNVRAGGGINYRILKVARKDDIIVVLEKAGEWLKIRCPEGCTVWVHSRYLKKESDGGAVSTGDKVNVRATNNTSSTAVAQLSKGGRVEIVGKKGDWFKIKTPENAVAWIFGEYVEYVNEYGAYVKKVRKIERVKKVLADLEKRLAKERAEGKAEQWDLDSLINGYRSLKEIVAVDDLGETSKDITARVNERLVWLTRIRDLRDKLAKARGDIQRAQREFKIRMAALEGGGIPSYTAKGWVEDMGPILGRPGTHRLMMGGKTMYVLKSRTLDLYDYVGFLVGVTGRVSRVQGWDAEVIDVRKIDVLHAEELGL